MQDSSLDEICQSLERACHMASWFKMKEGLDCLVDWLGNNWRPRVEIMSFLMPEYFCRAYPAGLLATNFGYIGDAQECFADLNRLCVELTKAKVVNPFADTFEYKEALSDSMRRRKMKKRGSWFAHHLMIALGEVLQEVKHRNLAFDGIRDLFVSKGNPLKRLRPSSTSQVNAGREKFLSKHIEGKMLVQLQVVHIGSESTPTPFTTHLAPSFHELETNPCDDQDLSEADKKESVAVRDPQIVIVADASQSLEELFDDMYGVEGPNKRPFSGCYGRFMKTKDGRSWLQTYGHGISVDDLLKNSDAIMPGDMALRSDNTTSDTLRAREVKANRAVGGQLVLEGSEF